MRPPFQLQSAASHKDIVEREHRSDSRTQTRQIPRPRSQCQTLSPLETRCLKPIGRITKTKPTPLISQGRSSHNLSLSLSLFILTIIIMIIFIYLIESIQQVFHFIREELGHDTLLQLYADMILLLGRNKRIDMAEELFSEALEKGLKPDTRLCSEMIGAYLQLGMADKAMQIYASMKEDWACSSSPDKFTFTILIRYLQKNGQHELAETLKQDCLHYVDSPDKFLQQLQQKQVRSLFLHTPWICLFSSININNTCMCSLFRPERDMSISYEIFYQRAVHGGGCCNNPGNLQQQANSLV